MSYRIYTVRCKVIWTYLAHNGPFSVQRWCLFYFGGCIAYWISCVSWDASPQSPIVVLPGTPRQSVVTFNCTNPRHIPLERAYQILCECAVKRRDGAYITTLQALERTHKYLRFAQPCQDAHGCVLYCSIQQHALRTSYRVPIWCSVTAR
jgi:hypothetical protein